MTSPAELAVPASIKTLLDIFKDHLKDVRFPDVDGARLQEAADAAVVKAEEVARLEDMLEVARTALQESQDSLLQKGQRALAYARIFAEDNEPLSVALDGVQLPRSSRRSNRSELPQAAAAEDREEVLGPPKRRGRPKTRTNVPLFAEDPAPAADNTAESDGEGASQAA